MAVSPRAKPALLASAHDVDLAALARAGDRRAFSELVRRHGSAVRGLPRRIGAAPALADRIARDAFLDAFERIAEFRGEEAFQTWVKRIAARRFAALWRRRKEILIQSTISPDGASAPWDDLATALGALTGTERLCLSLCYGGELSHRDVAEALRAPLETVKSHISLGLDGLARRLAPSDGDPLFETRLARLFAAAPTFADADLFALRVNDRLDRGWTLRGTVIGVLGFAGGLVVVAQTAATGVLARVQSLPDHSTAAIGRALDHILPWRLSISGLPLAGEAIWIVAALAALALGYAIVRAIREI
jgi:RNA polymerase sigma-70 factor (ECF subfamily)